MEISVALAILRNLSDGVNPLTGEVFPSESPYQQTDIIRALFMAINALEKIEEKVARQGKMPANAGKAWTEEEEKLLIDRFDKGVTINELSKEHNRTRGAINSRLMKLGKISLVDVNPPPSISNDSSLQP